MLGPQAALKWVDTFGVQILLYVLLGWGLNIVVGFAGLLDLGYVAFYAVGAYAYALLAHDSGSVVLGAAAGRGLAGRALGRSARLSGAAPARRLSRHRHPGFRRNRPHRADQLGRRDQRRRRHRSAFRADHLFRLPFHPRPARLRGQFRSAIRSGAPADFPLLRRSWRWRWSPISFDLASAPSADRPRLGGVARGRDRLPRARASIPPTSSCRPSRSARFFAGIAGALFAAAPGLRVAVELHLHGIARPFSPSSCLAAAARRSASRSPRC